MSQLRPFLLCVLLFTACGPAEDAPGVDGASDGLNSADGAGDGATSEQGIDLCPVASEPTAWPAAAADPPSCTPLFKFNALPEIASAKGAIELEPSAPLQPLGVTEEVLVKVLDAAGGHVDPTFDGVLDVVVGTGVTVLSTTPVVKGQAVLRLKLDAAGGHDLVVNLVGDARSGSVGLFGYETRLPVVELQVAPGDLEEILASPDTKIWKPVVANLAGVAASGKIRLHGGSSKTHPKKSLRVKLADGNARADGRDTLVLRAEWSDRTLLRYWLGLQVFASVTIETPISKARFIHLRLNDRFHGVMLDVERIDDQFLAARGLDPDGSLYEADPPLAVSVPGGNLTPLADLAAYRQVYQHHEGKIDYSDLVALIEVALAWSEEDFAAKANQVVWVEETLRYMATMAVIQNQDHIKKNYYLYRDPQAADCRWRLIPWDLDLSFGRLWTPDGDILDDEIFVNGGLFAGKNKGHSFYNALIDRLLAVPVWRERYLDLVEQLLDEVFTASFVSKRVAWATCQMQPDVLADDSKRSSNTDYLKRIAELDGFVSGRRSWLKVALDDARK